MGPTHILKPDAIGADAFCGKDRLNVFAEGWRAALGPHEHEVRVRHGGGDARPGLHHGLGIFVGIICCAEGQKPVAGFRDHRVDWPLRKGQLAHGDPAPGHQQGFLHHQLPTGRYHIRVQDEVVDIR